MSRNDQLIIENKFLRAKEIADARTAAAKLCRSTELLVDVYVQGHFRIADVVEDDLDLDYGWYKVTKIGHKWLTVYVPEMRRSFRVVAAPYGMDRRFPTYRLVVEPINDISVRWNR